MGRLLALAAVAVSLVGFIGQEAGWSGWWTAAFSRGSYVIVLLAIALALLESRRPNELVLAAQVLAAATAIAFEIVALVKYYGDSYGGGFPGGSIESALNWAGEAQLFAIAAPAFALTLARRRSPIALAALAVAAAMAVGTAIYAITLKGNFASYVWWTLAAVGGFLAASAAAGLERGGSVALRAPVPSSPGGAPGSDPGVE